MVARVRQSCAAAVAPRATASSSPRYPYKFDTALDKAGWTSSSLPKLGKICPRVSDGYAALLSAHQLHEPEFHRSLWQAKHDGSPLTPPRRSFPWQPAQSACGVHGSDACNAEPNRNAWLAGAELESEGPRGSRPSPQAKASIAAPNIAATVHCLMASPLRFEFQVGPATSVSSCTALT